MQDVISTPPRTSTGRLSIFVSRARSEAPSLSECSATIISAALLILSFPDFNFWPLAWVGLVPLFLAVAHNPKPWRAFILGWLFGTIFFYGSCYWLTYSMVHFGGIPPLLAFVLLLPGAIVMGIFPALFAMVLARAVRRWGARGLFLAPLLWPALEWVRLEVTGQLWNAIGYSQAYHPMLIQSARWGGVYAVGFFIVMVNAAFAFVLWRRSTRALGMSVLAISLAGIFLVISNQSRRLVELVPLENADAIVIAVQPNVPMDLVKTNEEIERLTARHFEMSEAALRQLPENGKPRLVIWPESPMNFVYGTDNRLRERLATFAKANNTSLLLNSQELAPNDGIYNSALLINQEGGLVVQYDKIRLLPFGEYVPLPQWLPGAGLIGAIVGDFTAGTNYQLMPVGKMRAGVFICIESAYPSIARRFTGEGADLLINISNDGYLGPTAVMRQHLANSVFRAVENDRQLLRVTNTGITAFITPNGEVKDATAGFRQEVRTWGIARAQNEQSFYATDGDLFAIGCALFSLSIFVLSFKTRSRERR
jgi:apolipoprotein N-acyltransferase